MPATPLTTLPVEVQDGLVLLPAHVNGHPTTLILDTGSTVATLDAEYADALALEPTDGVAQAAGGGTAVVSVTLATARTISLGAVTLRDQRVAVLPLAAVRRAAGARLHGTIGYDLFARYVVRVDYAARTVSLFDPAAFDYDGPGLVVPIALERRLPTVETTLTPMSGAPVAARLVLDLGTSGVGAQLASPFVRAHGLTARSGPLLAGPVGTGVGGISVGHFARLRTLRLGALTVEEPVVGLWEDASPLPFDGTVGAAILERTVLYVDYPRERVVVEPTATLHAPYPFFDASGLLLGADAPAGAEKRVEFVAAGSPAVDAGLAVGDALEAIDDRPAREIPMAEARRLLAIPGVERRLAVRRDGETRGVTLVQRALL